MKTMLKWGLRLLLVAVFLGVIEALVLSYPSPFFRYSAKLDGYSLYSDQPFTEAEALPVLQAVKARVEASALYRPGMKTAAFICNPGWRHLLFCAGSLRAGGLNYMPLTTNVFLSGGVVFENRLISPSGYKVPGEMTLAYFIAHEIAHTQLMQRVGFWKNWRLPQWQREGFADVVGRGRVFGRPEARAAYLADAAEMNWPRQAPYLRYNILLTYLLEQEGMGLDEILGSGMPQSEAEARLARFLSKEAESKQI